MDEIDELQKYTFDKSTYVKTWNEMLKHLVGKVQKKSTKNKNKNAYKNTNNFNKKES